MKKENRLLTIDGETLMSQPLTPLNFVVDTLLSQGLHILAGSPKVGNSWLTLWLCLCAAQGKPLWTFATRPCEVLYLCLEDSFQRIQSRLFDLTEDAPPTLHFAVMSQQLHNGLVEQIEQFLKEHPQTRLIVIDTLQRIRTAGNDANPYASDYRDIGVLKALADKHRIAILLVHHLRKKSLTEMQKSLTEMNKLLERVGNLSEKYSSMWIDWIPDFSLLVALKWIMLVLILGTAALAGWYGAAAIRGLFL